MLPSDSPLTNSHLLQLPLVSSLPIPSFFAHQLITCIASKLINLNPPESLLYLITNMFEGESWFLPDEACRSGTGSRLTFALLLTSHYSISKTCVVSLRDDKSRRRYMICRRLPSLAPPPKGRVGSRRAAIHSNQHGNASAATGRGPRHTNACAATYTIPTTYTMLLARHW